MELGIHYSVVICQDYNELMAITDTVDGIDSSSVNGIVVP